MNNNINYGFGLFFDNNEKLEEVKEILEENGIVFEEESSFSAAMNAEIENQLDNYGYSCTEKLVNNIKRELEECNIWDSLEESVSFAIEQTI